MYLMIWDAVALICRAVGSLSCGLIVLVSVLQNGYQHAGINAEEDD